MAKFLIFIDTNVWLDFYRIRGPHTRLPLLQHIEANLDRFISTVQVEMEFKKNRQGAILEGLTALSAVGAGQVPAFLAESSSSKAVARFAKDLPAHRKALKEGITSALKKPPNEKVYATAERLFRHSSPNNLTESSEEWPTILNRARDRYSRGYPPRKRGDTSFGDAINWEWMIDCAKRADLNIALRLIRFRGRFSYAA